MQEKLNFHTEIRNNKLKSLFIIGLFFFLIIGLGLIAGVVTGDYVTVPIVAGVFSIIYILIMYYSGDSLILSVSGAKEIEKKQYPHLYNVVEGLSIAAGVPMPKVYVINDTALNAFATGRDPQHAAVTVTTGLMDKLSRQELEGVIAHEMAHIKNFDIRLMMLTVVLVGVVTLLSDFLLRYFLWGGSRDDDSKGGLAVLFMVVGIVLAILSPLIAELIKLAVSRKREFVADAEGARLTRYPEGLASALEKISADPDPLVDRANKATAHLFISTPFRKTKGFVSNLFSTHPPIQERIKRLRSM